MERLTGLPLVGRLRGLANQEGALIPLARGAEASTSVEEVWRHMGRSMGALVRLADADAFGSLGLNRRDALWAIRGQSEAPLPLFVATDEREQRLRAEVIEPAVALEPMSAGQEVVED